ncbi:MAG: PAS domain S-box protein, partial [Chloroflexi bacterium]
MTMIDLDKATLQWFNDHAAQGILITDAQLTIRGWNQWLETHSGRTAEEMIGRNLLEAYPDLVARRLDQAYMRALAGQVVVLSQRLHHYLLPMPPANPYTTFTHMQQSVRIAPLMTDKRVAGTITVIDDVTERVEREEELKHQIAVQEALQEIDRAILTLDLQECLQRLVHYTASLVGAPIAAVLLRDQDKLHLGAYVSGERRLEVSPVDAENSVAAWAIRHGQAILIEDLTEQGSHAPPTPLDPNSQCVVAA